MADTNITAMLARTSMPSSISTLETENAFVCLRSRAGVASRRCIHTHGCMCSCMTRMLLEIRLCSASFRYGVCPWPSTGRTVPSV